ncbi:MAG: M23 family metallopeptidase [Bacteriovoracaceae bacterium]|jgi:murein DD-endopeptidase MepM/ murein hydrolase activator NlpD|nr:M23 family metallopeptidase [Bacteriovoracaceae bacterium]
MYKCKLILILIFLAGCTHKSGSYKKIAGKWKFVPTKVGIINMFENPRIYKSQISIEDTGMFIWPVPATKKISSYFGLRKGRHHDGIDIPSTTGSHIIATHKGKVSFSGWMRGYGKIIVLEHPGKYHTVYAHNSKNFVKKGQKVTQGQVIAKIGNTGRSTGPHLHFEIRKNNQVINPMIFFKVSKRSLATNN